MAKTANLNIRLDLTGGLPFEVKQPRYNSETETAMQETRDILSGKINAKTYSSAKELAEELDAH
jgi:DNA-damage-inducible protein J